MRKFITATFVVAITSGAHAVTLVSAPFVVGASQEVYCSVLNISNGKPTTGIAVRLFDANSVDVTDGYTTPGPFVRGAFSASDSAAYCKIVADGFLARDLRASVTVLQSGNLVAVVPVQ